MKTAKKILIIEGDPHIMRALASILEKKDIPWIVYPRDRTL